MRRDRIGETGLCASADGFVARLGGEEFAVLLRGPSVALVAELAQALRAAISQLDIPHLQSSAAPHVTISVGVAMLIARLDEPIQGLIANADAALYRAKRDGRDRVAVA